MPIYIYKCPKCFKKQERKLLVTERENQKCEKCNCKMERKISNTFTHHFFGEGFYSTNNG